MLFSNGIIISRATVNNGQILGPNPRRVSLTVFPPFQGALYLATSQADVSNTDGIVLAKPQSPVYLHRDIHGDIVCGPWFYFLTSTADAYLIEALE